MFLFFYLLKHPPGNDGKIYIMPTMLIALGGYGFYRIPLDYKIHVIRSRATPDEKKSCYKGIYPAPECEENDRAR